MNNDDNKAKNSKQTTLLIVVVIVLIYLYSTKSQESEQAREIFAQQTASAENENAISASATQKMKDKIDGCINANEAQLHIGSSQCVVGFLEYAEERTDLRLDSSEPAIYSAYFSSMPNTFYLYSVEFDGGYLGGYTGDCVEVWGEIQVDRVGRPALTISDDRYSGLNIEHLPDDICSQWYLR